MAVLPTDPKELQALLLAERAAHEAELKRLTLECDAAKSKLAALLRRYFGRSSEKLDPHQLHLALGAAMADTALAQEAPPAPPKRPRTPSQKRERRLEDLPLLETITLDLPEAEKLAPDGTPLIRIRDEITEEVDYRPGQLFRRQLVRPVYASPAHACAPRIAPLPARVIPGGQAGPGLIAHVVLSKYCDHLPIHRQEQMLGRLGPTFTRQAMTKWVDHACLLLQSVHAELLRQALATRYLQMDETSIAVLDPDLPGKAREAWLWVVHAPEAQVIYFEFHRTRGHSPPKELLASFRGVLQTDGWGAYGTALRALPGHEIVRAGCMAHARRGFVDALEAGDDRASPYLVEFGALYEIEAEGRRLDPIARAQLRRQRSIGPIIRLQQLFRAAASDPSILPQSLLGKAVHYCQGRWPELTLFTGPGWGHLLIDNNPVERAIRPAKLGLRNWLFVGHPSAGDHPAIIYSLIATCKLLGVDPWAYFEWALRGLAAATNRSAAEFTPFRFACPGG